jgi:hypothetical protein
MDPIAASVAGVIVANIIGQWASSGWHGLRLWWRSLGCRTWSWRTNERFAIVMAGLIHNEMRISTRVSASIRHRQHISYKDAKGAVHEFQIPAAHSWIEIRLTPQDTEDNAIHVEMVPENSDKHARVGSMRVFVPDDRVRVFDEWMKAKALELFGDLNRRTLEGSFA